MPVNADRKYFYLEYGESIDVVPIAKIRTVKIAKDDTEVIGDYGFKLWEKGRGSRWLGPEETDTLYRAYYDAPENARDNLPKPSKRFYADMYLPKYGLVKTFEYSTSMAIEWASAYRMLQESHGDGYEANDRQVWHITRKKRGQKPQYSVMAMPNAFVPNADIEAAIDGLIPNKTDDDLNSEDRSVLEVIADKITSLGTYGEDMTPHIRAGLEKRGYTGSKLDKMLSAFSKDGTLLI